MDAEYDAIVVGAGIGGLYAGAMLARQGQRVLVLEAHDQIGGYASTFTIKGFRFDVSLHLLGDLDGDGLGGLLERVGALERLEVVKPPYLYESLFDGVRLRLPNGDIDGIRRALRERFPQGRLGIAWWFWCMRRVYRQIRLLEWARAHRLLGLLVFAFAPLLMPLLIFGDRIPLAFALRGTRDTRLKGVLNQLWGYYGLPAGRINIVFPMAGNYGYYYGGGYYVKGGGQQLCHALGAIIEAHGGSVQTRRKVARILADGDRVRRVQLEDGTTYATTTVLASANPFVVYRELLRDWPASRDWLRRIEQMELSISACVLYIGLDAPARDLWPDYADSYELFANGDLDREAEYAEAMAAAPPAGYRDFSITLHSNVDETGVPAGKGTLNVFVVDNPGRWNLPDKDAYRAQKQAEQEKLLNAVEAILPGLREHIEVVEFATPVTMKAFTANEGGALYGFSQRRGQSGPFRRFRNRGPLKGLYFASAWSFPGGGYEGAIRAGDEVARLVLGRRWINGVRHH